MIRSFGATPPARRISLERTRRALRKRTKERRRQEPPSQKGTCADGGVGDLFLACSFRSRSSLKANASHSSSALGRPSGFPPPVHASVLYRVSVKITKQLGDIMSCD